MEPILVEIVGEELTGTVELDIPIEAISDPTTSTFTDSDVTYNDPSVEYSSSSVQYGGSDLAVDPPPQIVEII